MSIDWQRVAIVVPIYNEAPVLRQTLLPLIEQGAVVIAVDDGSHDESPQLLATLPVHRLRHSVNLGQGAALQTGMRYARQMPGIAYLVHFDADGQHRVGDLPLLLEPLMSDKADIVLGSRFLGDAKRPGLSRRLLLQAARGVNWLFTGLALSDAHNGLRALNRRALMQIELTQSGMAHATEILAQIQRWHLRYREAPVQIRYDAYSRHKGQSNWQALVILSDLLRGKFFP
jgi:polyprenyl-phospho-N-acetylgalactosaminyl synthase